MQHLVASIRGGSYLIRLAGLAAAYFVAAKVSLLFAVPAGYPSAVWWASGVAAAAAVLFGSAIWPAIWVGATLAVLSISQSLLAAIIIGAGYTLEALVFAALAKRNIGPSCQLQHVRDIPLFIAASALAATVGATVVTSQGFLLDHLLSWPEALNSVWLSWQGDLFGIIIVTPLILAWSIPQAGKWPRQRRWEATCLGLTLLLAAGAVFGGSVVKPVSFAALELTTLLFITWAAFRFRHREVVTVIAAISSIAIWCTVINRGPFAMESLNETRLALLIFVGAVASLGLMLGAIAGERSRAMRELRKRYDDLDSRAKNRTFELEQANRALRDDVAARVNAEKLLTESEARFRSLTQLSSDWYWEQDENFRFTYLSESVHEKSGYPVALSMGKARWELPYAEPLTSSWDDHRAMLTARLPFRDFEFRRSGGEDGTRHVSISGEPIFDSDGRFKGYRGIGRDVTAQRMAEEKIRESEKNLAAAQRIAQLGSWELLLDDWNDINNNPLHWSDETFRIYGYEPGKVAVTTELFFKAAHPDDKDHVRETMVRALQGNTNYSIEHRIIRPDSTERVVHQMSGTVFDKTTGRPLKMVGTVQDITERKQSEDRLAYLAQFDFLTGLPNRHMLHDRLAYMLSQPIPAETKIVCMFVDLDRFKDVNDTFGHSIGDKLLVHVAERLRHCVRSVDTVSRLGGDEFAIVLVNVIRLEDVGLVAQKIIAALSAPFNLDGRGTYISASIGIASFPDDGKSADELLINADTAMYHAKESGRNNYQFYLPKMNERMSKRLQLDASLRGALERNEFFLNYQPKVELETGGISGFEVLLRWQNPQLGLVPPAEFVPVLEDTGLVTSVGQWVLMKVCQQINEWKAQGISPQPMAINLSTQEFQQTDLDEKLITLIDREGVDHGLIEFEITEQMLMRDPEQAATTLGKLKDSGLKLSVDDFGTGYSSLANLKRFPLDALKIDNAFIRDSITEPENADIALAIINLAHNLELKVVAEGVENDAQLDFLRAHGCDEMQGYYFSQPLGAEECTQVLVEKRSLEMRGPSDQLGGPAVLIVDDNEDDLVLLRKALGPAGYRLLTANSSEEAFDILSKHKVSIVISDQRMPGMTGVKFLCSVRKLYPYVVRIVMSGAGSVGDVTEAVNEAGIHKYLSKDWDSSRLRAEVREAHMRYH